MIELNKEQKRAVSAPIGPVLVLAGPGSGKTRVIVNRVHYLVNNLNILDSSILVVTFTKDSALEMESRFILLNKGPSNVRFGTMHSVFFSILRQKNNYKNCKLITNKQKISIYKKILNDYKEILKKDEQIDDIEDIDKLLNDFIYKKKKPFHIDIEKFYNKYNEEKTKKNIIDFNDMINGCYNILKNDNDILKNIQNKYKHILIDEFQDINEMQYKIIKLICKNNYIYAVGDDDQTIYGFRYTDAKILQHFIDDYKCKVYKLFINYRSKKEIVDYSLNLINKNKVRIYKDIRIINNGKADVKLKYFKNREEQKKIIASDVINLHKKGVAYKDIAILCRLKMSFYQIEDCFKKFNIPYFINGKLKSIFDYDIINNLISFFCLTEPKLNNSDLIKVNNIFEYNIYGLNIEYNEFSLKYFVYYINNFLDEESKNNANKLVNDILFFRDLTPYLILQYIKRCFNFNKYIEKYIKSNIIGKVEIYKILDKFEKFVSNYNYVCNMLKDINKIKQKNNDEYKKNKEGVNILTVHASKGLEYNAVIIPDLIEGYFPKKTNNIYELEEERRLMYVAVTRAKDILYMYTCCENNINNHVNSRFISDLFKK